MTPPDRPKRPSARPSSRPSAPPPAPSARPVSAPPPAVEARKSQAKAGKKQKAPRVAARRPSVAPNAPSTSEAAKLSEPVVPSPRKPDAGDDAKPSPSDASSSAAPARAMNGEAAKSASAAAPAAAPALAAAPDAVESAIQSTLREAASQLRTDGRSVATPPAADDDEDIWSDTAPNVEFRPDSRGAAADARLRSESLQPASRLARGSSASEVRGEQALIGSAQSLLSTDYYFRQYGAHGMRSLSAEVDEFGLDPHVEESARPVLEALCKRYFRVSVQGHQQLPGSGRALIVANRSGTVPWDGLVLRTALRMQRPELPPVRWLSEDSVFHYPFLGVFMNRLGAVRACPENAERLLSQDKLVAVFPEGAQGSSKLFKDRYRLQRFGRGGYVRLALKLGAPIIPTAIIGAEETNPLLGRSRMLGKALGAEFLPITPTFPWLGALGLLPAPVKWRIVVGEPIDLSGYGPASADDALVVHRLNDQIRGILQSLVDQTRAQRSSVLFG